MFDSDALADMIRTIDATIDEMPVGVEYVALTRYMPPGALIYGTDELGRLYALVSEETLARMEQRRLDGGQAGYHGIPLVRLAAA